MTTNIKTIVVVFCLLFAVLTAGCFGVGNQQSPNETSTQETSTSSPPQGTSTYAQDDKLVISDNYPHPFNVTVENATTGERVAHQGFNSTNHGRMDLSAMIPRGSVVIVTVTSNNETLWEDLVAPSVWWRLTIRQDGSIEESKTEA